MIIHESPPEIPPAANTMLACTRIFFAHTTVHYQEPHTRNTMQYYIYILSSLRRVLYVGITNNLERRIYEHRQRLLPGFTARYHVHRLVYFETTPDIQSALAREKQIKAWRRDKKVALIEIQNPKWHDLSEDWM